MKNLLKILSVVFVIGVGVSACSDVSGTEGNHFKSFYYHGKTSHYTSVNTFTLVDNTYCVTTVMLDKGVALACDFSERIK